MKLRHLLEGKFSVSTSLSQLQLPSEEDDSETRLLINRMQKRRIRKLRKDPKSLYNPDYVKKDVAKEPEPINRGTVNVL